ELLGRIIACPQASRLGGGADCVAGLRPEHVAVHDEPVPGGIPFELDAVMPLNVRSILYLRGQEGQELLATIGEGAGRFRRGHRRVWATFAPEDVLLFDAGTGARVAPPPT